MSIVEPSLRIFFSAQNPFAHCSVFSGQRPQRGPVNYLCGGQNCRGLRKMKGCGVGPVLPLRALKSSACRVEAEFC